MRRLIPRLLITFLAAGLAACDHGIEPPELLPAGVVRGTVHYPTGYWPPSDSLRDLRFVALRFMPRDTSDLLQLNKLIASGTLKRYLPPDSTDVFLIGNVRPGVFVYSGIVQNFGRGALDWRPVTIYEENDGLFEVRSGDTTDISLTVDFRNLPPWPP